MPKSKKPFFSILTILIVCLFPRTKSQNPSSCVSSSCGGITISYPFRLASDHPSCGHPDPIFALQCSQNQTFIQSESARYPDVSAKYIVQSISYSNFSIRVSDPGIVKNNYSSCPLYSSFSEYGIQSRYAYLPSYDVRVTYVKCLKPVSNTSYVEDSVCGNRTAPSNSSRVYNYMIVGGVSDREIPESCSYDRVTEVSSVILKGNSNNYTLIHDAMAYGVEYTWYAASRVCGECVRSKGRCLLQGNNEIECSRVCYEDTPLSERSFRCKLDYYAGSLWLSGMIIVSLLGLRLILGILLLIGVLVYRRRKQRSSMDKSGAIKHGSDP